MARSGGDMCELGHKRFFLSGRWTEAANTGMNRKNKELLQIFMFRFYPFGFREHSNYFNILFPECFRLTCRLHKFPYCRAEFPFRFTERSVIMKPNYQKGDKRCNRYYLLEKRR